MWTVGVTLLVHSVRLLFYESVCYKSITAGELVITVILARYMSLNAKSPKMLIGYNVTHASKRREMTAWEV